MYARTGWSGGRAEKDRAVGSAIEAGSGAEKGLREAHRAAGDVTADIVGIVVMHVGGVQLAASEDAVSEARCEPLDLPLDRLGHIGRGSRGNVTIGPASVLAV